MGFPTGFMDVVQIEKTGENFRIIYDVKGRFTVHRITGSEAAYKLCRVRAVLTGPKGAPTCIPAMAGPFAIQTLTPRLTTASSGTSPPTKSRTASSSRLETCVWLLEVLTQGEWALWSPGRSILAPSTLFTSRTLRATCSLLGWLTSSWLARETSLSSRCPRARVSNCRSLKRETRGSESSKLGAITWICVQLFTINMLSRHLK